MMIMSVVMIGINSNYDANRSREYSDVNSSRGYSDDGEVDYKYKSPRESRKKSRSNSNSPYNDYNQYNDDYSAEINEKDNGEKTPEDLFEKHSRKFKR